jgi:hypothetical protein
MPRMTVFFSFGSRGPMSSRMTSEAVHATQGPALCLVAQGAKVVMLGREVLEYDPARMLVFAVDLPVSGQLTRASPRDRCDSHVPSG